ncbi:MAG: queuosine precursor transporter [Bacteroidales bacterium]|nr:queuosine precursor transporter [Bacteroidales bacterium]
MKNISPGTLYLILTSLFITSLVTSNLIFQKFFHWDVFGIYTFELSVGIIAYPITFLITDIISEIYGRKAANKVVLSGLFASAFALFIIIVSTEAAATEWSPVTDSEFKHVFGFTFIAVGASLAAYLLAQLIDVQIFHFFKKITKGKHLWLRNNFSTFTSQIVDTATVLGLLCSFDVLPWSSFWMLFLNGYIFKFLFALFDTPIIYLIVNLLRRQYNLQEKTTEIELNW